MTRRPITSATFLAAGLIAASGCPFAAPASAQEPSVAAPTLAEDLDSIAAAPVRAGAVAGLAVAVIRGRDTLLMRGYGSADLALDVPMPDDAVFEIGSATKQFTAAAILRLAEEGKLDLDHLLTEYLPRYPLRGNAVTVRHLLDHTSGIRGYTEIPGFWEMHRQSLPRDSLVRLFADPPFDFKPGTAMIYNNSAYYLLGLIIEEVSGVPYADYIETQFFAPLGMDRSSYCSNSRVVENRARGYEATSDGSFRRAGYLDHAWPYAGGSLCSTAGDLAAWLRALHGGEVLGTASYRAMITPDTLAHGHRLRYAMGITVDEDPSGRALIHHGGEIPGFLTETRYYPDYDLHIVVLLNSVGPTSPEGIADALATRVLGEPAAPELRTYAGDLDALTGTFTGAARGRTLSVTIRREGGELVAIRNDDVDRLRYLAEETFTSDPRPYGLTERYTFVPGQAGAVELHLDMVIGHYVLPRTDETSLQLWASRTPVTSMVDVDGHRVRIRTAAPHPRRLPGQPLVVLEAGFGSTVNSWGPFIGQVATVAPVLAYDRAGLGESEWDGQTPTFDHITGRLRRLLAAVGAEPPFVLVGHSFGGDLIRFFADDHPIETVGLVLLDPVVSSPRDFMRALEEIGAGEAEYLEVHGTPVEGPPGLRAEDEMLKEFFLNHAELDLPRPTHLPVSIIVTGLDVPPDAGEQYSFDVIRHVQAVERMKVARLGEWILQVPEGQMTVVPASGHLVHRDEPELALEAVRSVVYPDIARAMLAMLDSDGHDAAVARYDAMKLWYPVHRFHEALLNQLGYRLLRHRRTGDAIAIFGLNVREYPDAPNPHDSLADAYRADGNLRLAEQSYARAVEMADAAGDSRVEAYRRKLAEVRNELDGR
jgi:CubicO group peptidase (beta-lactamase class C family)/pimeloyl-ACP methyl ester carboxylesterase